MKKGTNLRAWRDFFSISQQELSERSGVAQPTISQIEKGETQSPHPGSMRRLAEALGITVEELNRPPEPTDVPAALTTLKRSFMAGRLSAESLVLLIGEWIEEKRNNKSEKQR